MTRRIESMKEKWEPGGGFSKVPEGAEEVVGETALAGWFPTAMQISVLGLAALLTLWLHRLPLLGGGIEARR